jgi:hypothetical protein
MPLAPGAAPMRALALLPLLALALAGCLGATEPAPGLALPGGALAPSRLLCIEDVCNFEATVEPEDRQANELSVAVNPLDPRNIIATGKDYTPAYAGDCTYAAIYTTLDGGLTWTNQNLPGSPWRRLDDPNEPETPFTRYWCATDPVVAFGPDGTAYWTVMPYQCDRASGSKLGREFVPGSGVGLPQGGLNDWLFTCSAMYVLVSEDGGLTWPLDRVRRIAEGPFISHDKQWLATSPDGGVLLCWDFRDVKTYPGGAATSQIPAEQAQGEHVTLCSRSDDQGRTWTEPITVGDWGFYPWIDFDARGRAWMAVVTGNGPGTVRVGRSDDGGLTWGTFADVAPFENSPHANEYGWPTPQNSAFRIVAAPSLAVDRSSGPHAGRVYVTFFDHAAGNGDVFVSWSDDGLAWSAPMRVHDDGASPHDQVYPAISVGPDGTVDVTWYDRRDDPANYLLHVYHTWSRDGGQTWAPNTRISTAPTDERHSHHQNGMVFIGDYRDNDSHALGATTVWVDTRHGKADVFVATVQR